MAGLKENRDWDDVSLRRSRAHGPMGTLGLGVKFSSRRGLNFSILFNMNVKNVNYRQNVLQKDVFGNVYSFREKNNATLLFPGIRFGLGFTSSGHKPGMMRD